MKATEKRAAMVASAVLAITAMLPYTVWSQATWTGGGADNLVNDVSNWGPHAVPGTVDVHFAGTTRLTPQVNNGQWNPLDIFFDAGAGAFDIGNNGAPTTNAILLGTTTPTGGNITNNSTNTQTFDVYVAPRAGTVSATSGNLVFNNFFGAGNLGFNAIGQGGRGNIFAGADNIYMYGQVTLGGFLTVNMTGAGTLYLDNIKNGGAKNPNFYNDFGGTLTINTGAVQINTPGALGLDPVDITASLNDNPGINTTTAVDNALSIVAMGGGASTGTLKLSDVDPSTQVASGGVTFFHKPITFNGRTAAAPSADLENVHGANTWQGNITLQTGGNYYAIQSDAGSLSITGNITNASANATERALYLQGAGGGTISGNITDASGTTGLVDIDKTGAGTWTLSGTNSSIGATNISGGTLAFSSLAAMGNTTAINLSNSATLDVSALGTLTLGAAQPLNGIGTVIGSVATSSGTTITPGAGATTGTLAITNNLTLAGGSTLNFGLTGTPSSSGGTNDMITVGGALSLAGTNTLNISLLNTVLGAGTYNLITYTGSESGGTGNLNVMGLGNTTRQTFSLQNPTGQINLVVSGNSANLKWQGGQNGNTWDLKTTANFFNNGTSSSDIYYDLDTVTFDDTGNAIAPVNLTQVLTPASVTVNSSQNYTFSGAGSLTGAMTLTKSGTGTLTVLTNNSYTGGTVINGGVVQVGNGATAGSLGTGPITDNASLVFNWSGSSPISMPGAIGGSGAISKLGSGEIDLGGAGTFAGTTTITGGTLGVGGSTPLGTNAGGTTISAGARLLTLGTINIPGSITVGGNYDGGADGAIQAGGGTATTAVTATLSGALNLAGNTQLAANQYSTLAINGSISGSGNLSLVGAGVITIAGANAAYSGATSVAAGTTVQIQNSANLGSSVTVTNGGEVYANSGAADSFATPITISGVGVDTQLGALRAGGAQLHTFNGNVTLAGDTSFSVDAGAQLNIAGNVTGTNTNLTLRGDAGTGRILGNLNLGTGTLTTNTVTAANAGVTWVLGGNAVYGATNINVGSSLQIGNGAATGNLGSGAVTNNGALNFNVTGTYNVTQAISGTGTVSQNVTATGGGTVVLSGNNSYSGITTIGVFSNLNIGNGILSVTNSSALGNTAGVYIVGNGATTSLDVNGSASGFSLAAPFFFSGRALTGTNTAPVGITSEGNNTLSGAFSLGTGGNAYGIQSNSGLLTISGSITNATATTLERYLYLSGAGNGLITGAISSAATNTGGPGIGVVKDGAGTWTLNMTTNDSTDSLTGDVIVKQGTLAIQGFPPVGQGIAATKIPTSITVYSGANYDLSQAEGGSSSLQFLQTLGGTGNVIMGAGGTLGAYPDNTISAGLSGTAGTLKIQGNLETSVGGIGNDAPYTGTVLAFGLDSSPSGNSDALAITGSLTADDTTYVTITPLGSTMAGTYTLINASGGISNGGNISLQNTTRYSMSLNTTSNQVKVSISGSVGNLTWSGSNGTWDTKNTVAWNGAPNGDGLFWTADNVTFDDSGAVNPAINIAGTVTPGSIAVTANNTNYTFNGGTIAGGGALTKSGTGTLTINTANTYSGKTFITNGVLVAGNAAALGSASGDTEISGSGTLDVNNFSLGAEKITIAGNGFNGEGALVNNGTSATDNAGGQLTTWATQSITLTGDATIGGTSRWDLRDSSTGANDAYLIGNGHNLIKTGTSEVWLVGAQVSNVPTITVNSGNLGLEDVSFTNTSGLTSIIDNSAMLTFWSNTPPTGQILNLNVTYNGSTTVSINDNDAGPSTVNGTMAVNGPSTWTVTVPFNVGATLSGSGVVTKAGTNTLTLSGGGSLGGLNISAGGTVNVTANTNVGQLLGNNGATLNVAGAKLAATNQNHATITLAALTLPNNGALDIGTGNLVIPYTGASPLNTIVGYIKSGYDAGKWDQAGLVTSAAVTTRGTTLAYRDTGTQVQVKFTWYGDLDFTGTVDSTSLTMMTAGNGTSWTQGDLNYDGIKNNDDWSLFMLGAASQNGSIPAGVPEPAMLGMAMTSALLFTSRRRRK